MNIIDASYEILSELDKNKIYKQIELAARTCYKSEDKITDSSAEKLIKALIKNKHEAMLEHWSISVKFICDRAIANEIVRHRLASYAQESTRYCLYTNDKFDNQLTFIKPIQFKYDTQEYYIWKCFCLNAETAYKELIEKGATAEEARIVLPLCLKTEIVMTANLREWRHFLNLRAADATGKAHIQIKELAVPLLMELHNKLPELFEDIFQKLPDKGYN